MNAVSPAVWAISSCLHTTGTPPHPRHAQSGIWDQEKLSDNNIGFCFLHFMSALPDEIDMTSISGYAFFLWVWAGFLWLPSNEKNTEVIGCHFWEEVIKTLSSALGVLSPLSWTGSAWEASCHAVRPHWGKQCQQPCEGAHKPIPQAEPRDNSKSSQNLEWSLIREPHRNHWLSCFWNLDPEKRYHNKCYCFQLLSFGMTFLLL